jgi:competence protein ComFC
VGFVDRLAGMLLPPRCIFCRDLLEPGTALHICGECYSKISFANETIMRMGTAETHPGCDGAICVCEYSGIVKDSLIRFKFYSKPCYYRTFARLISERMEKLGAAGKFDMVMSVPLHKQREYSRGYNQAYLISKAVGRDLKLPERSYLLKRLRNTDTQSLLDRKERRRNIMNAFTVTKPDEVKGKSILLVDDIMTTGFTLDECARMLKEAGAASVTAAVVATGRKF